MNKVALVRGSKDEYQGLIKLLSEEHIMYDILEPAAIGTERMPRKLESYEALILGDVSSMDERLIGVIDLYVKNGGKILSTGFTSTKDGSGKPVNRVQLLSPGIDSYEPFQRAKSTYLKIAERDKEALGKQAFGNFSLMMMYSDFLKCKPVPTAQNYMKFVPATRFGPPEKAYYTEEDITDFPGMIVNTYGQGSSVFIPWELGSQYHFKGHYMHRTLFVSALTNLLKVERTVVTDASPLIEMTHLANRNGAFEWLGLINQSGQIGSSFREPVSIYSTTIRFKPTKPIKKIKLMQSRKNLDFRQSNGWVECTLPQLDDFEMLLCLYE